MRSNRVVPMTALVSLLLSLSAARFTPAPSHAATPDRAPDACKLLTLQEASTALGLASQPGENEGGDLIPGCIWSHDSPSTYASRRINLAIHSIISYNAAKHPRIPTISTEPISGLGDDAFYALYSNGDPPFLWAKKGDKSISIRITLGTKDTAFTNEQLKSKLLVLGKAAIARL